MKRLILFCLMLSCMLPNAYGFMYGTDHYQVYEISPTTNSLGSIYITPPVGVAVIGGDAQKPAVISISSLPSNIPAYRFSLSLDGHLSAPVYLPNFTVADTRKMRAVLSTYKLYDGHFRSGSAHTFLLWDGIRDSALLDADTNGNPYIYYNFGSQFSNSKYSSLEVKDVDGNGFDDIVTSLSNGYTKVAFYSQADTLVAADNAHLQANQVGLLINDNDPYSVAIGEYYRVHRGIPSANIVHLQIPTGVSRLNPSTFAATIKSTVDQALPANVQVIAVAWTTPFAVGYCSITSALAQTFSSVQATACIDENSALLMSTSEQLSPYYNSPSAKPYSDHQMRPAMLLAARSIAEGQALIDRGIASDSTQPHGAAYIINDSSDPARSLRATSTAFPSSLLGYSLSAAVNAQIVNGNSISHTTDALFYFAGNANVPNLATNIFPSGAIADTLTSYGGYLDDTGGQINILDFISAGATGTFGTVSEPFADLGKFPKPQAVILRYTNGETLIEAYWKSISKTWQGLFIGEPLARPWP